MARPRTRSLVMPLGIAQVSESGDWLEVLDGGVYGYKNRITATLGDIDPATAIEASVPCVAGTILSGEFDSILATTPGGVADTVLVRVGAGEPPPQISGKPRVRWISRGVDQTIGSFSALRAVDLSTFTRDEYDADEHHELLQWCGWISASAAVTVWETGRADPSIPSTEFALQSFLVRALGILPAGLSGTTGSVCTFERGAAATPAPGPLMPNSCGIQIHNGGAGAVTVSWMIGLRG